MPAIYCLLCGSLADVSVYKKFQELIAMTPRQYTILALIAHNEGLPQVALCRALNMVRSKFTSGELKDFLGYLEQCTAA